MTLFKVLFFLATLESVALACEPAGAACTYYFHCCSLKCVRDSDSEEGRCSGDHIIKGKRAISDDNESIFPEFTSNQEFAKGMDDDEEPIVTARPSNPTNIPCAPVGAPCGRRIKNVCCSNRCIRIGKGGDFRCAAPVRDWRT